MLKLRSITNLYNKRPDMGEVGNIDQILLEDTEKNQGHGEISSQYESIPENEANKGIDLRHACMFTW